MYNDYKGVEFIPYRIIEKLFDNEDIFKLLKYGDKDALSKPPLTTEEKRSLIWGGDIDMANYSIFLTDKIGAMMPKGKTILLIDRLDTTPKTEQMGVLTYIFKILLDTKTALIIKDGIPCSRKDVIFQGIMSSLNGVQVGGVGNFKFSRELSVLNKYRGEGGNNDDFTGAMFTMSTLYTNLVGDNCGN